MLVSNLTCSSVVIVVSGSRLDGFLDLHNVSILYYARKTKTAFLQHPEEAYLRLFLDNSFADLKNIMRGLRETTYFMIIWTLTTHLILKIFKCIQIYTDTTDTPLGPDWQ